jgi:hypothetical protein
MDDARHYSKTGATAVGSLAAAKKIRPPVTHTVFTRVSGLGN